MEINQKVLGELALKQGKLSLSTDEVNLLDSIQEVCVEEAKKGKWSCKVKCPEETVEFFKMYFKSIGLDVISYGLFLDEAGECWLELSWRY